MAEALPIHLRERVVAAIEGGMSRRQAAAHFSGWRVERDPLDGARAGHRRLIAQADGRGSSFGADGGAGAVSPVDARRTVGRDASRISGGACRKRPFHWPVVDQSIFRAPWDHAQKKTAHATEQDRPDVLKRREVWFDGQLDLDPEKLVFIDEAWASTNMARRYGRAPKGERLRAGVPFGWSRLSFLTDP